MITISEMRNLVIDSETLGVAGRRNHFAKIDAASVFVADMMVNQRRVPTPIGTISR